MSELTKQLEEANWNLWVECEAVERELDELSDRLIPVMKIDKNGNRKWRLNGKLHREDGPAVEYAYGDRYWYLNGLCYREDGPACEYTDETRFWYRNGKKHCEVGPAVERADGTREWWLNGQRHRVDGPAIEYPDGTRRWYLNGKRLSEEAYKKVMELLNVKQNPKI